MIQQGYYITDRRKCENTKRYNYEQYKKRSQVAKKTREMNKGMEGKDSKQSADDLCFRCAFLISNRENP